MWVQLIQIHDTKPIKMRSKTRANKRRKDRGGALTKCPLHRCLSYSWSTARLSRKHIPWWLRPTTKSGSVLRLPGGYIGYNTNIMQATSEWMNEFLKRTINRETTAAADIALALASLPATYTSNILSCCFASIKFPIKSDISSKSGPWGGNTVKN